MFRWHLSSRLSCLMAIVVLTAGCSSPAASEPTAGDPALAAPSSTQAQPASASEPDGVAGATPAGSAEFVGGASPAFYQNSSLTKEALLLAVQDAQGGCTVATVNENGTPNIAVFVPGVAGTDHLCFTWQENNTKKNVMRTKQAVLSYFIYSKDEAEKEKRNRGARVVLELETDEAVLKQLLDQNPALPDIATFMKIVEVLPLG